MHKVLAAAAALVVASCGASPLAALENRQSSCPNIHIFGARETTAPAGYGTAGVVVNLILQAFPGSTAEAIVYPACGGQASCGGASYASSASQGTTAVAKAVNDYAARCPNTQIVLVGYSQGAQITDNAFCGGGDSGQGIVSTAANTINSAAAAQVKAVIEMGNPRYIYGLAYEIGTCRAQGFSPRPAGFSCPAGNNKIQSYCDAADPYCCTGNDQATHQGYGSKYGQAALTFVKSKLNASGGGGGGSGGGQTTTQPGGSTPTPPSSGGGTVARYGQCGGQGYSGPTQCAAPYTCKAQSQWYSQCL